MLKNCVENVEAYWKFQGVLNTVFKISWCIENHVKISRCVENPVKKFQGVLKTMVKISRCIENHVENFMSTKKISGCIEIKLAPFFRFYTIFLRLYIYI